MQWYRDIIEKSFRQAGFPHVKSVLVDSPLLMPSAKDCVRFEKESFGALHQLMSGLTDTEKESVWEEIEQELKKFEIAKDFIGPCEMIVAIGTKE